MENPEDYIHHSLNGSVSKQTFSFSRSHRFKTDLSRNNYQFYDLPSMRSRRAPGIGYGEKTIINNKSISPPPGAYEAPTQFKTPKQNTCTFAKGRQEVTFNGFAGQIKKAKKLPAPNHYRFKTSTLAKKGGMIGLKLDTQLEELKKKNTPGPGTYHFNGTDMNKSGSYFLSTYQNNLSPRYYQNNSALQLSRKKQSKIGPGQYKNNDEFGKSLRSKFRNSVSNTFMKSQRNGFEDKTKRNIPGSKYKSFSQFGHNC